MISIKIGSIWYVFNSIEDMTTAAGLVRSCNTVESFENAMFANGIDFDIAEPSHEELR